MLQLRLRGGVGAWRVRAAANVVAMWRDCEASVQTIVNFMDRMSKTPHRATAQPHNAMTSMCYILQMRACAMALKRSDGTCGNCQYRSCCGLAERNVRLYYSGTISEARLAELSLDLLQICPLANAYEQLLLDQMRGLPIACFKRLKRNRHERKTAVQEWLRRCCPPRLSSTN